MPSSATSSGRFEKQGTGENTNQWGIRLNNSLDLIDAMIAGATAFTLSGSVTLTSANYVADQARAAILNITGGSGGTVTIPGVSKTYFVRNGSSGVATITTGAGTTVAIAAGAMTTVFCDGSNVYEGSLRNFGTVPPETSTVATTANQLVNKAGLDAAILNAQLSGGSLTLGPNVADFLADPTSARLKLAVTDETGSGALVFANTPTLISPILGTPTSGILTNCTGIPISGLVDANGMANFLQTRTSAALATAVTDETGTGALVFANSPALVTPNLGTPMSGDLSNCTNFPAANLSGTKSGTGVVVLNNAPSLINPDVTTQTAGNNTTKAASTAFVQTAVAAGISAVSWTQVAFAGPGTVNSVTLNMVGASQGDLKIEFDKVKFAGVSTQTVTFYIAINNGGYINLFDVGAVASGENINGSIELLGFQQNDGSISAATYHGIITGTGGFLPGASGAEFKQAGWFGGAVTQARVLWSVGAVAIDTGTIRFYAR